MRKYRPQSWSAQARKFGNRAIENIISSEVYSVPVVSFSKGEFVETVMKTNTIAYNMHVISNSYRPAIIRNRAAKRVRRFVRKHKITI